MGFEIPLSDKVAWVFSKMSETIAYLKLELRRKNQELEELKKENEHLKQKKMKGKGRKVEQVRRWQERNPDKVREQKKRYRERQREKKQKVQKKKKKTS